MVKPIPYLKQIFVLNFVLIFSSICLISQPSVWNLHDDPEYFGIIKSPYSNAVKASLFDSFDYLYTGFWGTGVFKSTNRGKDWIIQNSGLTNLYITGLIEGRNGIIIASTMGGGVFVSEDRAKTWKESNTGLNHKKVKTIIKHSNNWIILGTYGGGVYISKDDGKTWNQSIKGLYFQDINALSYTNNGYIIAGTQGGGIYASRDTGRTWIIQNTGLGNKFINAFQRDNNGLIYAATNGRGVYNSPNDGLTWTELDTFMTRPYTDTKSSLPDLNVTSMSLNKRNQIIFGTRYGGVFYYDDYEDFTWVSSNIRGTGINSLVNDKKGNNWAFINNNQPQYTETNGETWDQLDNILEGSNPKLFIIGKGNLLLYDNKGALYLSKDDGENWENAATLGFALNSVAKDSVGTLYAGADNGLYRSYDSGKNWERIKYKDTIVHDVEVAPNGYIWVVASHSTEPNPPAEPIITKRVINSNDGGFTWNNVTMDLSKFNQIPKKIAINNNNIVYIGLTNIFFYTADNGTNWKTSQALGGQSNDILDVSIDKNGRLYAATYFGLWANTNPSQFELISLFMSYNYAIHVDRNGIIYGSGSYRLPNDFTSINLSYRTLDTGKTFKVLNNSFNSDEITSITSDEDGDVYFTTSSGIILKSVSPETMKAPTLITLIDEAQNVENQSELSWNSVEKAELYQVEISIDEDFIFNFENFTTGDTTYKIQKNFDPYTKYYWRARSKNHAAISEWSETRIFISKIGAPSLISPDSNAVGVPVYAELKWSTVKDAELYDIIVSKYSDFRDTVFQKYDNTDTVITSPLLEGLTTYFWKVRAKNQFTTSYWSNVWNFKTVLGPPLLISPINNDNGYSINLNMVWHQAIDADSYLLVISEDAEFTQNVKEYNSIDTSYEVQNLEYDKFYWWKVASKNNDGQSEFSAVWTFRTAYSPITLLSPENKKANIKIPVNLEWMAHEKVNNYHIQVSTNDKFTKLVLDTNNIQDITKLLVSNFNYFTEYFWRARVEDESNTGVWSEEFSFKSTLAKAGLRSPANNSKNLPTDLTFLWFGVNGAKSYHLQISRDNKFEDLFFSQDTLSTSSISIGELPNKSELFWRVRGVNDDGFGEWSDVWTFTTSGNAPSLISPKNGAENIKIPIVFQWSSFGDALSYNIQISASEDFSTLISDQNNLTLNKFTINDFIVEPSTTYYWKVIANMNSGQSNWSQAWSFTTDEVLDVDESSDMSNVNILPNPAINFVNIQFYLESNQNSNLEIIDMSGRRIYHEELNNLVLGQNTILINTMNYSNGVYFFRINNGKETINGEFIINK